MARTPGENTILYAYLADQGLGGFAPIPADGDNLKLILSRSATVTGRVIDTNGKPQAWHRVGIRLANGPLHATSARFDINLRADEHGQFTFKGVPVRSEGELSAPHQDHRDSVGRTTKARTVIAFAVSDLEPVEVPDLVVPAEKPTN